MTVISRLTALLAGVALSALATESIASISFTATPGGGPIAGATRDNFDWLNVPNSSSPIVAPQSSSAVYTSPQSGLTLTLTGGSSSNPIERPQARIGPISPTPPWYALPPYVSGLNGVGFGNDNDPTNKAAPPAGNQTSNVFDNTVYLTTGSNTASPGALIEILLPFDANYFGVLWGSADDYNTLQLFKGSTLVGTVPGTPIENTPPGSGRGTYYVNIFSDTPFDRVVFSSSEFAFEFDNVAFAVVPEPAALGLFGLAVAGLAALRRRAG